MSKKLDLITSIQMVKQMTIGDDGMVGKMPIQSLFYL